MTILRALLLLLLTVTMVNSRAADNPIDIAKKLFVLSGLSAQIQYIPETFELGVVSILEKQQRKNNINTKEVQHFVNRVRESYSVEKMSDVILSDLSQQLTSINTQPVFQWLSSDLGQHFTFLEKRSSQPEQMVKMGEYVLGLSDTPLNESRWNLVVQLSQAISAKKTTLHVLLAQKLAEELTQSQFIPVKTRPSLSKVVDRVSQQQATIEEEITNLVIYGLLFTYQTASYQELELYLKFANSSAGKMYHKSLSDAYHKALIDAGNRYGRALYGP